MSDVFDGDFFSSEHLQLTCGVVLQDSCVGFLTRKEFHRDPPLPTIRSSAPSPTGGVVIRSPNRETFTSPHGNWVGILYLIAASNLDRLPHFVDALHPRCCGRFQTCI